MARATRVFLLIGASWTSVLHAQASLTGFVRADSGHTAIAGAELFFEALGRSARTDDGGHFVISDLAPGVRHVLVRRIGYKSVGRMVQLVAGEVRQADFALEPAAVRLDSLVVTAHPDVFMRDFEENRRLGLGHFFTRAELEKRGVVLLEQAFDGIPSARVVRDVSGKRGTHAYVYNQRHGCFAHVYLDHSPVYRGRRDEEPFDIHLIPVDAIEAVEYYSGPAGMPLKYSTLNSNCGVVVIWTRRAP
jgi:hypothetical protein